MARPIDPALRARILDAAMRVFAERGFGGATMAQIGERAGVTKGGVYFHFRGKEELFFAVFDARRADLRALLTAAGDATSTGAAALRRFVRDYLEAHFRDPETARLLRVLVTELQDRFTAELREDAALEQRLLRARLRELLARGNHDGSLFCGDPALSAFVLAAAVRGIIEQWLTAPGDTEPFCRADALADELVARHATGAAPKPSDPRAAHSADDPNADFRPPF